MKHSSDPNIRRPVHLRRSWLFLPGADRQALLHASKTGADVLIQEFEDFTVPARRPEARALCDDVFSVWRASGCLVAARINPLETADGPLDLEAVMAARPDIVLMPKCANPDQIIRLDKEITALETKFNTPAGNTEIVPNIESARGLVHACSIAEASKRVTAMLVASEDMAADLNAERSPSGDELAYVRQRFLVECTAAGVIAIDCPYTFADTDGARAEAVQARRWGYRAKSLVNANHVEAVNSVLTPSEAETAQAKRLIDAFELARSKGQERATLEGHAVELPTYNAAKRLVERAQAFMELSVSSN